MAWEQMKAVTLRNLDELYAGACDGMTYAEIEAQLPAEWALRCADKLAYRYPRGESYLDVLHRLEPVIMEMERCRTPLLIVGHQGILRLIYAYFRGIARKAAPHVCIPLNTVIQLTPSTYACSESRELLHTSFADNADGQGARTATWAPRAAPAAERRAPHPPPSAARAAPHAPPSAHARAPAARSRGGRAAAARPQPGTRAAGAARRGRPSAALLPHVRRAAAARPRGGACCEWRPRERGGGLRNGGGGAGARLVDRRDALPLTPPKHAIYACSRASRVAC